MQGWLGFIHSSNFICWPQPGVKHGLKDTLPRMGTVCRVSLKVQDAVPVLLAGAPREVHSSRRPIPDAFQAG
jgi:hypothetical protein